MKSILIKDTTQEEREEIVSKSIGNISGFCDECSPGIVEMYEEYITGNKELAEINMNFRRGYMSKIEKEEIMSCGRDYL